LLWSDEFDGVAGAAPDLRTWSAATGYGWGKEELQCYTSRPRNLALDGGGHLVITAMRERSCDGASYSSARIETVGKYTIGQGYVEVRAMLPTARGSFPAVWMVGTSLPSVGWPASGELDLVEVVSAHPRTVHTNIHWAGPNGDHRQAGWRTGGAFDAGVNLGGGYHTYGVERTPSRLRFFFDGRLIRTVNRDDAPSWPWDGEFNLLLNLAIDGQGAQVPAGDYPQRMSVDYVRVYDAKPGG
jgi:beta-glucanase (GH16 family)